LRDPDEAEDVVQEAHMRALAHLDQFQGRAALSTWVMQIVTNEALIRLRRRVPSVELDSLTLRSESSDPEEEVAGRQLRALILAGIRTLPEPYRTAFYIRVICEKSAAETAAYLGVTIGCVKTRLHRAKSLLRKKLRAPLGMASAAGGRRRVRIPASLDLGRRS
jgi:RNA polymerase sigma-70 factor (ECF subfamily)